MTQSGLVVSLRETSGVEKYVKALESPKKSEQRIVCDHVECLGQWDPDFYHRPSGSEQPPAEAPTENSTKPGLAKVVIAPTRIGGIRAYGSDGILVYRVNTLARSSRLQR